MSKNMGSTHIYFDELVKLKVPAFSGRGTENNRQILQSIALNGPMLKYGIHKHANVGRYSTVSRRVDRLVKKEYLGEASKRITKRGKQTAEPMYGLTWRGFIASMTLKDIRENVLSVLSENPLLAFPEKDFILPILEELITPQELDIIISVILKAFLKTIPNLEFIENDPMTIMAWLLAIREKPPLPEGFTLSRLPQEPWELLDLFDKPAILQTFKNRIIPLLKESTKQIELSYYFLQALNVVGDFILSLEVKDQPSTRLRKFLETELKAKLSEQKILPKIMELSDEVDD